MLSLLSLLSSSSVNNNNDDDMAAAQGLVNITLGKLLLSVLPLVALAAVSAKLGLQLTSPLLVGSLRTFLQLSLLGAILTPIFTRGNLPVVIVYIVLMLLVAAHEAAARSLYSFEGLRGAILAALVVNVCGLALFSFGFVLQPTPLWNPQYVIPIVGMLLGNCINGVSLAMNSFLTSLAQSGAEVELLQAFGATTAEAAARPTREAVRTGALPLLNSMAVIGLVSIPGMMTGQILGGTPAAMAARYQMMICYLIAAATLGTILTEVWLAHQVLFRGERLFVECLVKRPAPLSFVASVSATLGSLWIFLSSNDGSDKLPERSPLHHSTSSLSTTTMSTSSSSRGSLQVHSLSKGDGRHSSNVSHGLSNGMNGRAPPPRLELRHLSRTLRTETGPRQLFSDVSVVVDAGDMMAVVGPSGVGKSQLLRLVAGLTTGGGDLLLNGQSMTSFGSLTHWRRQVRYVCQAKVDIPGTPQEFLRKVTNLACWKSSNTKGMPSYDDMWAETTQLMLRWGLDTSAIQSEWKHLSGGEAQRCYLAMAVASRPAVLLLDESTSALDMESKTSVEGSLVRLAAERGIAILWITHDPDLMDRLGQGL
jgi:putative ABC transport system permease protein